MVPPVDLHIDGLANVVPTLVPVYLCTDRGVVRLLGAEELKGGLFADRGRRLYFLDGRSELRNLAITQEAMSLAVTALLAAKPEVA